MKVIYSDKHRLHAPARQFAWGASKPHDDPPERAEAILSALCGAGHEVAGPRSFGPEPLQRVHSPDYLEYLATAHASWTAAGKPAGEVIPSTFPVRLPAGSPGEAVWHAGLYCFDTETPIGAGTFAAAVASAECALTGAELLLSGERAGYALTRPPGHHAGRDFCGGYCYLNNAALAARRLADSGRGAIAVLDLDCHHGNGTQDIFYRAAEALCVSIHADPDSAFPYYWGYAGERGEGDGEGANLNLPLPRGADDAAYFDALAVALEEVERFGPAWLIVSLGTDGAADDPVGVFTLAERAFPEIGARVGAVGLPCLVVQEGGYNLDTIGRRVSDFLAGLEGSIR
jgi:acetoin utilization deacetylase AcuC-like enzyme